jgi:hypothetical protein
MCRARVASSPSAFRAESQRSRAGSQSVRRRGMDRIPHTTLWQTVAAAATPWPTNQIECREPRSTRPHMPRKRAVAGSHHCWRLSAPHAYVMHRVLHRNGGRPWLSLSRAPVAWQTGYADASLKSSAGGSSDQGRPRPAPLGAHEPAAERLQVQPVAHGGRVERLRGR